MASIFGGQLKSFKVLEPPPGTRFNLAVRGPNGLDAQPGDVVRLHPSEAIIFVRAGLLQEVP